MKLAKICVSKASLEDTITFGGLIFKQFAAFLCFRSTHVGEDLEMGTLNADADKWEISRQRITLEEVIGSGSFGTVWRAVLSNENGQPGIQFVAAKCFSR